MDLMTERGARRTGCPGARSASSRLLAVLLAASRRRLRRLAAAPPGAIRSGAPTASSRTPTDGDIFARGPGQRPRDGRGDRPGARTSAHGSRATGRPSSSSGRLDGGTSQIYRVDADGGDRHPAHAGTDRADAEPERRIARAVSVLAGRSGLVIATLDGAKPTISIAQADGSGLRTLRSRRWPRTSRRSDHRMGRDPVRRAWRRSAEPAGSSPSIWPAELVRTIVERREPTTTWPAPSGRRTGRSIAYWHRGSAPGQRRDLGCTPTSSRRTGPADVAFTAIRPAQYGTPAPPGRTTARASCILRGLRAGAWRTSDRSSSRPTAVDRAGDPVRRDHQRRVLCGTRVGAGRFEGPRRPRATSAAHRYQQVIIDPRTGVSETRPVDDDQHPAWQRTAP